MDLKDNPAQSFNCLSKAEVVWSDAIAGMLFEFVKDKKTPQERRLELLESLIKKGCKKGIEFALQQLDNVDEFTVCTTRLLMQHKADEVFETVFPIMQRNPAFGQEVILQDCAGTQHLMSDSINKLLKESQLADLYIWLREQFPHVKEEDESEEGLTAITREKEVRSTYQKILTQLQHSGTSEAVEAMTKIADRFREETNLQWNVQDAKENARRNAWSPLTLGELVAIVSDPEKTVVRDHAGLLNVTMKTLGKIQEYLGDKRIGAAEDFWMDGENPKGEVDFSRKVAELLGWFMERRNFIINREVRINRSDSTDIKLMLLRILYVVVLRKRKLKMH